MEVQGGQECREGGEGGRAGRAGGQGGQGGREGREGREGGVLALSQPGERELDRPQVGLVGHA